MWRSARGVVLDLPARVIYALRSWKTRIASSRPCVKSPAAWEAKPSLPDTSPGHARQAKCLTCGLATYTFLNPVGSLCSHSAPPDVSDTV